MEFLYSSLLTSVVLEHHARQNSIHHDHYNGKCGTKKTCSLTKKKKKISSVCRHRNFKHQPDHLSLCVDKRTQICSIGLQLKGKRGLGGGHRMM